MNAAIYARYSSENQRDASIEDQLRICREYCEAHDLTVVAEYPDAALSGLTDARPQFQRMIKEGEHGVFDVLVLYSLDRFARDKYDSAIYKRRLKKAGVQIAYVTTPVGEGPEAVLMESLLEGMAQYYSENLSRSIKRGLQGNALRGVWANGCLPFGFTLTHDRHLQVDPQTAPAVRKIYEWYRDGVSRVEIARRLNAMGHKTTRGKPFAAMSLAQILKNQIYIGTYVFCGIVNENAVEPIIDRELFDAVQRKATVTHKARAHNKAVEEFILTTKLHCGKCGRWLVGDSTVDGHGRRYSYYVCTGAVRPTKLCDAHRVRKSELERTIINACRDALTDEHIIAISDLAAAKFAKESDNTAEIKRCEKQLAEIEKKIKNILTAMENGILNDTVGERLTALENDRAAVREALGRARVSMPVPSASEIAYYLKSLRDADAEDPDYQKLLINNLLNSATLYDLPDGSRKIAIAFNLTADANCEIIAGKDILDNEGLTRHSRVCGL